MGLLELRPISGSRNELMLAEDTGASELQCVRGYQCSKRIQEVLGGCDGERATMYVGEV